MHVGTRDVNLGKSPAILNLSQASSISWEGRSPGCFCPPCCSYDEISHGQTTCRDSFRDY